MEGDQYGGDESRDDVPTDPETPSARSRPQYGQWSNARLDRQVAELEVEGWPDQLALGLSVGLSRHADHLRRNG